MEVQASFEPILRVAKLHPKAAQGAVEWATELAQLLTRIPTTNGQPSILSPPVLTGLLIQLDGLSARTGEGHEALERECTGTVHHIKQWLLSKADKAARLGVGVSGEAGETTGEALAEDASCGENKNNEEAAQPDANVKKADDKQGGKQGKKDKKKGGGGGLRKGFFN